MELQKQNSHGGACQSGLQHNTFVFESLCASYFFWMSWLLNFPVFRCFVCDVDVVGRVYGSIVLFFVSDLWRFAHGLVGLSARACAGVCAGGRRLWGYRVVVQCSGGRGSGRAVRRHRAG